MATFWREAKDRTLVRDPTALDDLTYGARAKIKSFGREPVVQAHAEHDSLDSERFFVEDFRLEGERLAGVDGFAVADRMLEVCVPDVSDPANPVPYRPRPVRPTYPGPEWPVWMLQDQRFTQGRPDVLTYETEPLTEDVLVAGSMSVRLYGSTSGTDCDWIARLIDVYPEEYLKDPTMAGYQLLIAGEPLRGRFRKGYEKPEPVKPAAANSTAIR